MFIKNLLYFLIGLIPTSLQKRSPNFSDRILFVHLSKPLGDFVCRIKFLNSISFKDTQKDIFLVINEKFKSLEYLINSEIQIIYIKAAKYRFNPFYRYSILKKLQALRFTSAINISVDRGMFSDEIALNCGANEKITLRKKNYFLSKFFEEKNNQKYSSILNLESSNEYDRMDELKIFLKDRYRIHLTHAILNQNTNTKQQYLVIAPFASIRIKSWPFHNYLELIERLQLYAHIKIVGEFNNRTKHNLDNLPNGVENLVAKTNLQEVVEIIKGSFLFIGNDSGLMHLAYLFNIPIIGVIGGGSFGKFFPRPSDELNKFFYHSLDCFNCNWRCKFKEPFCLTRVSVESVYNSAIKLLNE